MRAPKARAAEPALVENADEIDDHILAAKALLELRLVVNVAILHTSPGSTSKCLCSSRSRDNTVTR